MPVLDANDAVILQKGLFVIGRCCRNPVASVRALKRSHDLAVERRSPPAFVGRQHVASRREVGGHAQHEGRVLGPAQLLKLESRIQHHHLVYGQLLGHPLQQLELKLLLIGLAGRHAFDGHGQRNAYITHSANPGRQTKRDRWQRLAHLAVVMLGLKSSQPRSVERRQIHRDGLPSLMLGRLPLSFRFHLRLPVCHHALNLPRPVAQRRPAPPHRCGIQAQRCQPGDHRAARAQQPTAQHHPRQIRQPQIRSHRHILDHIRQQLADPIDYLRHRAYLLSLLAFGEDSPMSLV